MSKTQLGTKRVCPSCGARFYDLTRRPIECPKCGFSFEPDQIVRARKTRVEPRESQVAAVAEETEEDELPEDEADEDLLETEDEADAEPLEDAETEEPKKKPVRRGKRAPALEEEEDVGVLPDEDEEDVDLDVDVEVDVGDDVLVEDDELGDDDLSDIIEDDGKDEPV